MNELQKKENNLPLPIQDCIDIAYRSMKGELIGVEDIAAYANLSIVEAIKVITNPIFNQMVHHLTLANAKHSFDAIGFKELIRIARFSDNDKDRINAIRVLADMVGRNESKKNVKAAPTVNINIDQVVRNTKSVPFKGF